MGVHSKIEVEKRDDVRSIQDSTTEHCRAPHAIPVERGKIGFAHESCDAMLAAGLAGFT
jgi:hypothetical protein